MNLRPCMVHVGMYKTGTTSIQTTLYWRLRDRRFRLLTRDAAWGNLAIRNESDLFAFDAPSRNWLAHRTGRATLPVAEQLQCLNRWIHPSVVANFARERLTRLVRHGDSG